MNSEKPNYGYTAIKYFLGISIVGLIGLLIVMFTFFIEDPLKSIIFMLIFPIAITGLYIGASYIPLYHSILRPTPIKDVWKHILKGFRGDEQVLDIGCGTGRVSINIAKHLLSGNVVGIDIYSGVSGSSPDTAYDNAEIEIVKPLHPMIIWKNPQTDEKMAILLIHYKAKLLNKDEIKPIEPVIEVTWLDIEEIKQGKHDVAPNIKFLIEKGDIK